MADNTSFLDDFDPRAVLEQLLNTGKQYAEKRPSVSRRATEYP
jgi:hypothetical protein